MVRDLALCLAWSFVVLCSEQSRSPAVRGGAGLRSVSSPSPHPSPRGEGEPCAALSPIRSASTRRRARCGAPPPCGKGRGGTGKYGIVFKQCFQGFPLSPALSPLVPRGERERRKCRLLPAPWSPVLRTPLWNAVIRF